MTLVEGEFSLTALIQQEKQDAFFVIELVRVIMTPLPTPSLSVNKV